MTHLSCEDLTLSDNQAELEEREERKRMQELKEQERRKEEEKERLLELKQVTTNHSGHRGSLCPHL